MGKKTKLKVTDSPSVVGRVAKAAQYKHIWLSGQPLGQLLEPQVSELHRLAQRAQEMNSQFKSRSLTQVTGRGPLNQVR